MSHLSYRIGVLLVAFAAAHTAGAADQKTWKPEVRSEHNAIRALAAAPKEPVLAAIRKLASLGLDAQPAIMSLAADPTLPEPHRAYAGIMSAHYVQFDTAALRTMALAKHNPFASRQAVDFLADIGGPEVKAFLEDLARKDPTITAYIGKALARSPPSEAIPEQERKLLSGILLGPLDIKQRAAVVLVGRHQGKTSIDAGLESVAASPVADTETQMHAALALSKIHKDSVPRLKALTARNRNRFVRYTAIQELGSKGPAGEAVLRELLASPDEPLRPQIEKRLAKK